MTEPGDSDWPDAVEKVANQPITVTFTRIEAEHMVQLVRRLTTGMRKIQDELDKKERA